VAEVIYVLRNDSTLVNLLLSELEKEEKHLHK
jgi:hypothetical protein